ncbi:MAG: SH3 domain-containing protein [Clostridia bacterium]|nr:SH3 domain-containing protein [Clostridia bacterium]
MIIEFGKKGIRKLILAIVLVAMLICVTAISGFGAREVRRGVVTTSEGFSLNIRSDAGTSNAAIGKVYSGDIVTIVGEKNAPDGVLWYLIEHGTITGYVTSQYIQILPDETTAPPDNTTAPDDTTTAPDGTTTAPDGTTTAPDGTTTAPDGTTTAPDGTTTAPDGTTTAPDDTTTGPDDTTGGGGGQEIPEPIDFEAYLTEQGFPESYKPALRELHALYPNWIFKAQHVEFDFYEAVQKENEEKRSLVWVHSISSWKSTEGDAYDWASNTWKGFDGANWVMASKEIIAHYMDPRNFLGVNSVFQFLEQSYDGNIQNIDGVKKIIAGTFMENDVIDSDGSTLNYATAIFNAGKEYQVNPYVLAAMIVQEQGTGGTSGLISGTYPGYAGYYNYFNIGAYADGNMNAVQRGLWYAKGGNTGGTSNLRPWTSRLKAINGGAYYYAEGYTNAGQNTLYLKRFNIQGEKPFTHQYMTNIQGAASEAGELAQGYSPELRTAALSFYIPVYKNMPENAVERPTGDGSPNMKLSSLSVTGWELTPDFDPETLEYMLVLPASSNSIVIKGTAMDATANVEGLGEVILNGDNCVFEIKVTAGNGSVRIYKLTVAKEDSDNYGNVSFTERYKFVNTLIYGIAPNTTVGELRKNLMEQGSIKVRNKDGFYKLDVETVSSLDTICVLTTKDVPYGEYQAVVLGEINGDGNVTVTDLIKVRNLILDSSNVTEVELKSADIDGNGSMDVIDLIKIRNHILGTGKIS